MLALPDPGPRTYGAWIGLSFDPDKSDEKHRARWERSTDGKTSIAYVVLSQAEMKKAIQSKMLSFSPVPKRYVRLALGGGPNTLAAFNRCADDLLRSWGGDPAAQRDATPAVMLNQSAFLDSVRFPTKPANQGKSGEAIVRHFVTAAGRVEGCTTLFQSGARSSMMQHAPRSQSCVLSPPCWMESPLPWCVPKPFDG